MGNDELNRIDVLAQVDDGRMSLHKVIVYFILDFVLKSPSI
jgi:hypothetical protein